MEMLVEAMHAGSQRISDVSQKTGGRLTDALLEQAPNGFSSLSALPSNVQAIEASLLFANGLQPFVALVGPSGWGKSHMLHATAQMIGRHHFAPVHPAPALQWVANQGRGENHLPLLLDDSEDAVARPRARQQLRQALERRMRSGRPTMLSYTDPHSDRALKQFLPFAREWSIVEVGEPTLSEKELIVRQMSASKGMSLPNVVIRLVAHKLPGNGRSILGCLQRLRLERDNWVHPEHAVQTLGLLAPLLGDESGWDPRDLVLESLKRAAGELNLRDPESVLDLLSYGMSRIAHFGEKETGAVLSIDPGSVYMRTSRVLDLPGADLQQIHTVCEAKILTALEIC